MSNHNQIKIHLKLAKFFTHGPQFKFDIFNLDSPRTSNQRTFSWSRQRATSTSRQHDMTPKQNVGNDQPPKEPSESLRRAFGEPSESLRRAFGEPCGLVALWPYAAYALPGVRLWYRQNGRSAGQDCDP